MESIFLIKNIAVIFIGIEDPTEQEAENYIEYVKHKVCSPTHAFIASITITACDDDMIDVDYLMRGPKFERIRRITGYLSGDLASWNDSKRDEERDRIKHAKF